MTLKINNVLFHTAWHRFPLLLNINVRIVFCRFPEHGPIVGLKTTVECWRCTSGQTLICICAFLFLFDGQMACVWLCECVRSSSSCACAATQEKPLLWCILYLYAYYCAHQKKAITVPGNKRASSRPDNSCYQNNLCTITVETLPLPLMPTKSNRCAIPLDKL